MYKHILFFCSLLWCLIMPFSQAQSLADEKDFVSDLQKEIQQQCQLYRNREVPICSLAIHIETTDDYTLASSMGSLTHNQHQSQRTLVVDMFVGDLQKGNVIKGSSCGKTILLPLDYNTQAISHILHQTIKTVYDKAEQDFLIRQDRERVEKTIREPQFFIEEDVWVSDITAPQNANISIESCKRLLNNITALWNTFGADTRGQADLHYRYVRCYDFLDNGTSRIGDQHQTTLKLSAYTCDKSRVLVPIEKVFLAEYPADLPDESTLLQEETALFEQLQLLSDAPAACAASCPVLFSNQAAALALYATRNANPSNADRLLSVSEDPSHFTAVPTSKTRETELTALLKRTIRNQNQTFGYRIQSARYSESGTLVPQIMYRVYPDERPDELVRGTVAFATPHEVWSQIAACGDMQDCSVTMGESALSTMCCAPSILCRQLELHDLPPLQENLLLAPAQKEPQPANPQFSNLAAQTAQDEIRYFFEDTNLLDFPKPYDIEYLITDGVSYSVQSTMGSTLTVEEQPLRSVNTRLLVGTDRLNNENLSIKQKTDIQSLPLDNNYANMLEAVHLSTDNAYRQALLDYSRKIRILDQQPAEQQRNRLPDRSEAKRQSYFHEEATEAANLARLQEIANDLSAQFASKANEIFNTGVNIQVFQSTAYFISAQNIQYAQPFNLFYIQWFAEVQTDEGDTLRDKSYRVFHNMQEIPDLKSEISAMADRLLAFKKASQITDYYNGPMMISEEAVSTLLAYSLLENSPSLLAVHDPADKTGFEDNYWERMKNKQVVSQTLSVSADYTSNHYENTPLIGHFSIDAEGTPVSRSTELIHNGTLVELLSSRNPSKIGKYSNGHRRLFLRPGGLSSTVGAGILQVECRNGMDENSLTKELLKQARANGYKYAYQIVKLGCRQTADGETVLYPLFVYRIKTANGEKTAVRVKCGELVDAELLNRVVGTSSEKKVFNILHKVRDNNRIETDFPVNGIPASIIAPGHFLVNRLVLLPGK